MDIKAIARIQREIESYLASIELIKDINPAAVEYWNIRIDALKFAIECIKNPDYLEQDYSERDELS